MDCPCCGHDNIPGVDYCEECGNSMMRADVDRARMQDRIARSLGEDRVSDLEPLPGVFVSPEMPLAEGLQTMRDREVGCLLVTGREGKLIGILTERDLLVRVAAEDRDVSELTVGDVMTDRPDTVQPNHILAYALHRMMVGNYRYLPLVAEDGKPAGIISCSHIIRYLSDVVGVCQ
jgi:CBS domain-containing protein